MNQAAASYIISDYNLMLAGIYIARQWKLLKAIKLLM